MLVELNGEDDCAPLGGHLWSPSYFALSCGGAPIETVRKYIEDQRG